MKSKLICGIDPGASGAIAFLKDDGTLVDVFDMPTYKVTVKVKDKKTKKMVNRERTRISARLLCALLAVMEPDICVLEQITSQPGEGVTSAFSFGHVYGIALGAIGSIKQEQVDAHPKVWKGHFNLLKKEKFDSILLARELYPEAPLARKKDDGRAEAILIAKWYIDTELNKKEKSK